MAATIICDSTGRIKEAFQGQRAGGFLPGDIVIFVRDIPKDLDTLWADGKGGLRLATAEELAVVNAGKQATKETALYDSDKMLVAVAQWVGTKFGVSPEDARTEILTIFRGL